jgi:hypothetical protein
LATNYRELRWFWSRTGHLRQPASSRDEHHLPDPGTTERVVVLNLPGQAQRQFRLRLPASPSHSLQFGPWHLADGIIPDNGDAVSSEIHDAFAIRYRVR